MSIFYAAKGQDPTLDSWLKVVPKEHASFSNTELHKINTLISNGSISDYWAIDANALRGIISEEKAILRLPGLEVKDEFLTKWAGNNRSGQLVWEGEAKNGDGYATILMDKDRVFGRIRLKGENFMLYTMGQSHTSVLIKKNRIVLPEGTQICQSGSDHNEVIDNPIKELPNNRRFGATGNCDVRTLVVYTPAAETTDPNIVQTAQVAIAETNSALRNSGATANDVTIISVGIIPLGTVPAGWMGSNSSLGSNSDRMINDVGVLATDPMANLLRTFSGADIVICLTDDNYGGVFGRIRAFNNATLAYAIVTVSSALPHYTFAHEVAHLFDARHASGDNGGPSYARGYLFSTSGDKYRTIVTGTYANRDPIPHYSNPNRYYLYHPTGTSSRNNARRIMERACAVAGYVTTSNLPLNLTVYGAGAGYPGDELLFMASVSGGGPGAYSYEWRISNTTTPSGPILSTNFELETTLPNSPNTTIYVHAQVTSADGQVRTDFQPVNIQGSGGPPPPSGFKSDVIGRLTLYPNPANDQIIFSVQEVENGEAIIGLYNALGERIREERYYHVGGNLQHKYTINDLPTGVYFVKIEVADEQILGKFIKEQ